MRIVLAISVSAAVLAAGLAAALAAGLAANTARAQKSERAKPQAVDRLMTEAFKTAAPDWQARVIQDPTQKVCTTSRNQPSDAVAAVIRKREKASIKYPDDGTFMGDWKKGEALAQSGYGGRYTDIPPRQENGGNCYACHQLDKTELSYGTLGPSLTDYGRNRKFSEAATKAVYEHIYNPQASQPCANMPRFGTNGFLSIGQIRDLVAYVMSPESPVNK